MKVLFSVVLLRFLISETTQLTVHTAHGFAKGLSFTVGPYVVHGFRNIPFAEKPIGNLRLQLPKKFDNEYMIEEQASTAEHRCPQPHFPNQHVFRRAFQGEEDCLYLDVYVREENNLENSSLPVLVYFHGGAFVRGGKGDYGPDFLLRFGNVVLVVPNYRLGILGFLNHHDPNVSANLGLWDQRLALQWVAENIAHFGGHPGRVTIAGHEAGGVSVGLHILSHASQDYFLNAISISGCALTSSLFNEKSSPSAALEVTQSLNCPEVFADRTLACLQAAALHSLMETQTSMRQETFLPSVDIDAQEPFVPMHPRTMYQKGCQKNVKYLVGYAENEVSAEVKKEFPKVVKYQHLDKMFGHFLSRFFGDSPNFATIVKAVKYHYMKGVFIPTFESIEPRIVSILTDFLYKSPLEQLMKFHQRENVFTYLFQKEDEATCGAGHRPCFGDEFYLFDNFSPRSPSIEITNRTLLAPFIESFGGVWNNFIEYGHPDPRGPWKTFSGRLDYIAVSDTIQLKTGADCYDVEFWSSLVLDLMTAQNVSEQQYTHLLQHEPDYSTIGSWGAAGLAILCSVLCVALIGLVVITKRRNLAMSISPASSRRDVKFSRVNECI